jgi:regulatory protein
MEKTNETLIKASKYCAYRERCAQEVRHKLTALGASPQMTEKVLAELITTGFVNEERFSRMFAVGKFHQKKWGRNKIAEALKARNISPYCIAKGLEEITESEYEKALGDLISKKTEAMKVRNSIIRNNRVAAHCIRKGYESELVWSLIRKSDGKT